MNKEVDKSSSTYCVKCNMFSAFCVQTLDPFSKNLTLLLLVTYSHTVTPFSVDKKA